MKGWTNKLTFSDIGCWDQIFEVENVDIRNFSVKLRAFKNDRFLGYITRSFQDSYFTNQNYLDYTEYATVSATCPYNNYLHLSYQVGIYK